jgi:hypothetical protein
MKNRLIRTQQKPQRLDQLLAVLLIVGLVVTPLALAPQPATAQSSVVDSKMAVVGLDGAALLDAPGGKTIAQLAPGDVLTALARTADDEYLQVATDRGVEGWVATASVVVFGIDVLPVFTPPTPTSAPTATPTRQATPTAQSTPTAARHGNASCRNHGRGNAVPGHRYPGRRNGSSRSDDQRRRCCRRRCCRRRCCRSRRCGCGFVRCA